MRSTYQSRDLRKSTDKFIGNVHFVLEGGMGGFKGTKKVPGVVPTRYRRNTESVEKNVIYVHIKENMKEQMIVRREVWFWECSILRMKKPNSYILSMEVFWFCIIYKSFILRVTYVHT